MEYDLDWNKLIDFKENNNEEEPKLSVPFYLSTTYLKREFILDIVIWNMAATNLIQTQNVVRYILRNFNKLFETAWTAYYYINNADCTLFEFYQKIDFEQLDYYTIRLEINSNFLMDDIARYHIVVATDIQLSDDDIRLYMKDNKCWGYDTNNDGVAILSSANYEDLFIPEVVEHMKKNFEKQYIKMEKEHFLFAESFCKYIK